MPITVKRILRKKILFKNQKNIPCVNPCPVGSNAVHSTGQGCRGAEEKMTKRKIYLCIINDGVHSQFALPLCRRHIKKEWLDSRVTIVKEVSDKLCFNCLMNRRKKKAK